MDREPGRKPDTLSAGECVLGVADDRMAGKVCNGAQQSGDFCAFLQGEFRSPDVEQEDDAGLICLILCFVLDAIVKNDQFAFFPLMSPVSHA